MNAQFIAGPNPLTVSYLRGCGFGPSFLKRLVADSMVEERRKAALWLEGQETRAGKARSPAIRGCGRLRLRLRSDGSMSVLGEQCRDRGCPRCAVKRARVLAHELRQATDRRRLATKSTQLFVTLTQPKMNWQKESCGEAVTRCLDSWARATRSSSRARNAAWRDTFSGGLRALEVTWSGRNTKSKRGDRRVKYSGYHAHLHCIFEVAKGASVEDFTRELMPVWEWASPGADSSKGCNVKLLDPARVGQLCKYVTKPFDSPPRRARDIFAGLESRQTYAGFGAWRGWRDWCDEDESEHEYYASCETLDEVAYRHATYDERGRGARKGAAPRVVFATWKHSEVTGKSCRVAVASESAGDVRAKLAAAAPEANEAAKSAELARRERAHRARKLAGKA